MHRKAFDFKSDSLLNLISISLYKIFYMQYIALKL